MLPHTLVQAAVGYRASQATMVQSPPLRDVPSTPSVASRTEKQATPGVVITYFSELLDTTGDSTHVAASWQRKLSSEEWVRVHGRTGYDRFETARCDWCSDATSRCGFTWDDAAAKMNYPCREDGDCMPRPREAIGTWPDTANWTCYTDLPTYGRTVDGVCTARDWWVISDTYCQQSCSRGHYDCDSHACSCQRENTSGIWNSSAPVQRHDDSADPQDMPKRNASLVEMVLEESKATPSGLPACLWKPSHGCTNTTQYECIQGDKKWQCSSTSWFGTDANCSASCVHVSLLAPAPYYALWVAGAEARPYHQHERRPRYKYDASELTMAGRGIHLADMDVLMSRFCRSEMNQFVGVSLYSPTFREKASRLVRSCERNGVCCKAMELASNVFGDSSPEGSDSYRFQTIAVKPAFILSQLEATELPVVYLDTDLEFHRFPKLFLPGSWPGYDRDVALFNFWGNESFPKYQSQPQIGSALAYFNTTFRAKHVLTAWAEAMAWELNAQVPDDQVLSLLLSEGGWLKRASFGWLPTSYLRLMPSFYRGVVPIVEHDHGSVPGKHSSKKPQMPPVRHMELCEPHEPFNHDRESIVSVEKYHEEVRKDEQDKCDRQLCDRGFDGSEGGP